MAYASIEAELVAKLVAKEAREVARTTSAQKNNQDPLGDGDQSFVPGPYMPNSNAQSLVAVWCGGLSFGYLLQDADAGGSKGGRGDTFNIAKALNIPAFPHLALAVAACRGNAERVEAILAPLVGEELHDVLERRVTPLRSTPLILACAGSRSIGKVNHMNPADEAIADHMRCVRALLRAGARIDACDVLGMTPWHHCLTSVFSSESLNIAKFLLLGNHGGKGVLDVNAQSRSGRTALIEISMDLTGVKMPAVTLALEAGVDPSIREADGYSPLLNCSRLMNPGLHDAISSSERRKRTRAGRTLEGLRVRLDGLKSVKNNGRLGTCGELDCHAGRYVVSLDGDAVPVAVRVANVHGVSSDPACTACGVQGTNHFACSRCLIVFYCNADCQKVHWKKHKPLCKTKEVAAEGREWIPKPAPNPKTKTQQFCTLGPRGTIVEMWQINSSSTALMVLKVQAPLQGEGDLCAYDENRSFVAYFPATAAPLLTALIAKQHIPKVFVAANFGIVNGVEGIYVRSDTAITPPSW